MKKLAVYSELESQSKWYKQRGRDNSHGSMLPFLVSWGTLLLLHGFPACIR